MKHIASLLLAAAFILPAAQADDGKIKAEVTYLGQGQFVFRKQTYAYADLVAAIRAAHPDRHVDVVLVDMGTNIAQLDKATVCQLRQSLQAQVTMRLTVDDEKRELFCN